MTDAIPKLAAVAVIAPNVIDITWATGRSHRVDLGAWIEGGGAILAPLADPTVFATARIDDYGCGIAWGNDDDLAIDALHLAVLVEDAEAVSAYDEAKAKLARGENELIPADRAKAMLDKILGRRR
jgi:hypothetical protein